MVGLCFLMSTKWSEISKIPYSMCARVKFFVILELTTLPVRRVALILYLHFLKNTMSVAVRFGESLRENDKLSTV